jgi:hypothetical protein
VAGKICIINTIHADFNSAKFILKFMFIMNNLIYQVMDITLGMIGMIGLSLSEQGVFVQCLVDWRKMTMTNSDNYARLKRAGVELLGVVCSPDHHLIEVEPDMHTKFIIFNDEDCAWDDRDDWAVP